MPTLLYVALLNSHRVTNIYTWDLHGCNNRPLLLVTKALGGICGFTASLKGSLTVIAMAASNVFDSPGSPLVFY